MGAPRCLPRPPTRIRDAVDQVIGDLNAGRLRVAESRRRRLDVNQWIKKAVLLSFRLHDNERDARPATSPSTTRCRPSSPHLDDAAISRAAGVRVVPPAVARRGAFIGRNVGADAVATSTSAPTSTRARWSTPGPRSAPARRSARTCTCRAASASAACSSRCRPTRRSSRTTASSARAPKWSKASSSRRTRCSRMGVFIGQSTKIYRPRHRRNPLRPRARRIGRGPGQPARGRRQLQPVLRGHRQAVDAQTRAKTSINELLRA